MIKQITLISAFLISALLMPASVWACHYGCYEYEPVGVPARTGYSGYTGSPYSSGYGMGSGYASSVGLPAQAGYAAAGGW